MWVRLKNVTEALAVRSLLKKDPAMKELVDRITESLMDVADPNTQKLIDAARDTYTDSSEDIEIDDDAALSKSEHHVFVMGWLYVAFADAALEPADADERSAEADVPARPPETNIPTS